MTIPEILDPNAVRYKLTVAYDGTDFHGWQKQEPIDPDAPKPAPGEEPKRIQLRTVQHVVEQAVRETIREPVNVLGASRTDSGVHALGQVCAFTSIPDQTKGVGWPIERGTDTLVRALNSALPRDVLIMNATTVPTDFNPIGGAIEKEYCYTMVSGSVRPLWDRRTVFHTWYPLDCALMQRAASHLVGEHDFASFAQIAHGRKTTVRTVFSCVVEDLSNNDEPGRVAIRIRGSGFLYNMVRIVAGTLMEVGRGKIDPDAIPEILRACDRTQAGPTLPPQGLRLEWIRYAGEEHTTA